MKPAVRIIFAPLLQRSKLVRDKGHQWHGKAEGRTVWIDPRSGQLLDTLVHELTHVKHPSWSEAQVNDYTRKWLKKSSWKRKAEYLRLLGRAIIEGEG